MEKARIIVCVQTKSVPLRLSLSGYDDVLLQGRLSLTEKEPQTTGMSLRMLVNGAAVMTELPRTTPLLSFLRNDLLLNGPKYGCGLGECGACSILVDGKLARACVLSLAEVEGRSVTTLEGLSSDGQLDPVQRAFIACAATQCGYCLNGMIMTAHALIEANPDPSDSEIREAFRFNLCRCGAHLEILAAVRLAATMIRA